MIANEDQFYQILKSSSRSGSKDQKYGMSVCLFSQSVRPGRKADPLEQTERQTNYSKITRDSTKLSKISYK